MAKPEKTNAMRSLERMGIVYETLTYASCGTAVDAQTVAALMNVPPDTVYKTLVLLGSDRQHYVCVIPGPRELDLKLASAHFGIKSMAMLPMAQLKDVTGYERGGCSPVGMKKALRCAVDARAEGLDRVIVSGGRIGLQVRLSPDDLLRAAGAVLAPLSRPK